MSSRYGLCVRLAGSGGGRLKSDHLKGAADVCLQLSVTVC